MTTQIGGKLLGHGVYGCAFDPPLICKDGYRPKRGHVIGKVTGNKQDAELEFAITAELGKRIPLAEKYYILVEGICTPAPRSKQKEKDIPLCPPLKGIALPNTSQIFMSFGGKPLRTVPRKLSNINFFELTTHILEAGALLCANQFVHGDLHTMNVLLDSPSTGRFIDFGLAWSPTGLTLGNVHTLDRYFNPAISQEPPEISVLHGLGDNLSLEETYARIKDDKVSFRLISEVYRISIEELMSQLRKFVKSSWSFQHDNRYAYYKLYWSKIDSWAIGMMTLSLFIEMLVDTNLDTLPVYKERSDTFLAVAKGLCEVDPALRLDAVEALQRYAPNSQVLQDPAVSQWIVEQDRQRGEIEKILL